MQVEVTLKMRQVRLVDIRAEKMHFPLLTGHLLHLHVKPAEDFQRSNLIGYADVQETSRADMRPANMLLKSTLEDISTLVILYFDGF